MTINMRKQWFEYVAKIRKKEQRKTKGKVVSHRDAMKLAAVTWQTEKLKIMNREKRLERKAQKDSQKAAKETPQTSTPVTTEQKSQ